MTNPQQAFSHLLGLTANDVKKGHGSFVTFSLTASEVSKEEDSFVWIYMCHWRILDHGAEIAHSESPDHDIHAAVSRIDGRRLTAIALNQYLTSDGLRHGASLNFDDGLTVKLYQYDHTTEMETIFRIRSASGVWASYQSDGTIEINEEADQGVNGHTPPDAL
jgi:hypothetical protein